MLSCDVSSAARGRLTAVVNCAGVLACHGIASTGEAEWDRVFDINVKGTYLVCRDAIGPLRAAGVAAS